ncbi:MAG: nitrate ABC transporter permease, partial [Burkholderia sp.]|nr:nitrate ABC transporter permease [Burkholderia sp.]
MFERIQALARGAVLAAGLWAAIPAAHAADAVRVNLAWLPQGSTGGIL